MFKYDLANNLKKGGTFLLNTSFDADDIVKHMPNRLKKEFADKGAKFYIIDANKIAARSVWVVVQTLSCSLHSSR